MKKMISIILLCFLTLSLLTACTGAEGEALTGAVGESLRGGVGESLSSRAVSGSKAPGGGADPVVETNPLLGSWLSVDDDDIEVIFFSDGRMRMTEHYYGESIDFTYRVSGNNLTITVSIYGQTYSETGRFEVRGDSLFVFSSGEFFYEAAEFRR